MFTEQFTHEITPFLQKQADALVGRQHTIASVYYNRRTGHLASSLEARPEAAGLHVSVSYPMYIRFLDLRRGRGGRPKKGYEPIYNRYVYGYLYGAVYNRFRVSLHNIIVTKVKESIV